MLSPKAFGLGLVLLPYVRNENVRWFSVDLTDLKQMGFKVGEIERYRVLPGDLLVCEGGVAGRCSVYEGGVELLMFQKAIHRVRVKPGLIDAYLLQYAIRHFVDSGQVISKRSQTTIEHLPLEKMKALPVPVPPAAEQHRIVSEIETQLTRLDSAVAPLEAGRIKLKRYRAAVLKAACEGRLVPTEAELARVEGRDYEPADRLLARVAQERRARWEADQLALMAADGKRPANDKWKQNAIQLSRIRLAE